MYSSTPITKQKNVTNHSSKSFLKKKDSEDLFIQKKEDTTSSPCIQAKFIVGKSNDVYEQQANNAAMNVMQSKKANITPITSLTNSNTNIQTKSNSQENSSTSSSFTTQLKSSKGKGSSLSESTNKSMSTAFNTNFDSVKVHTDNSSINMNNQLKSRAFTNENNIYFNSGEYAPNSPKGKRLLAHELTHVIQQKGTNGNTIQKQEDEDIPVSQNVLELEPLSRVPQWAHQRWERLNPNQRSIVFLRMAGHYGMEFAGRFWQLANAGTHDYSVAYMNRTSQRRNIRFRDEIILRQGYINAGVTQERDALNRLFSSQYEVWLHPDGRMIFVAISNPSNVDTSNTERLVPEPPDVSLPEPEMRVPETDAPSVGGGDQLELEGQTPTETPSRRRSRAPRLGGDLTPPNFDDLRLNP